MTNTTRDMLLMEALKEVPFSGYSDAALRAAAEATGVETAEIRRHFPKGGESLVEAFSLWADTEMETRLAGIDALKIRERIAAAVRVRLEVMTPHREAARRAAAFLALPQHAPLAARLLFATVDRMWRAAGDQSNDFNYYTKRALLAGVYGSTLVHWLADSSDDQAETWQFLSARIDDVMKIQKARGDLERGLADLPNPLTILDALKSRVP
jgi:ubiquinone biosynthesis protein COQ9